jgi:hypothetical protein
MHGLMAASHTGHAEIAMTSTPVVLTHHGEHCKDIFCELMQLKSCNRSHSQCCVRTGSDKGACVVHASAGLRVNLKGDAIISFSSDEQQSHYDQLLAKSLILSSFGVYSSV